MTDTFAGKGGISAATKEGENGIKLQSAESEWKVAADMTSKAKRTEIPRALNNIFNSLWLGPTRYNV